MPKVLIAHGFHPSIMRVLQERGITAHIFTGSDTASLKACIRTYDGLAVHSATEVSADIFAVADNLKVMCVAGMGANNVDLEAATSHGVVVMNAPSAAIIAAEYVIALLFSLAWQVPAASRFIHSDNWGKLPFAGIELIGKTIGIIGCGNVGSVVANRALALKMKVLCHDPYLSPEMAYQIGVESVPLDELYQRSDFITLHLPLWSVQLSKIDAESIACMKKGVRIISCEQHGLVVEEDLKTALESGQIAGAALTVFQKTSAANGTSFSLHSLENVIAVPDLATAPSEKQESVAIEIAAQISDFLLKNSVSNSLNTPAVTADEAPRMVPYLKLARYLGSFVGQIMESPPKEVDVEYEGIVAELPVRLLTASILEGLLSPLVELINLISAPVVAMKRGIHIREIRTEQSNKFETLIRLRVTTSHYKHSIAGTLFDEQHPRIVEINDADIEAELGGYMLYVRRRDVPGTMGNLVALLNSAGVEVVTFKLGRDSSNGDAIALIEVNKSPTDEIIRKMRIQQDITEVTSLKFRL